MIKQLVFTLFLLFSLSFFSSCSIFGGGDSEESTEGEDYYSEEEMDEVEEPVEEMEEEGEAQYEEIQEGEYRDEEDVYYIDEEDEDILEAEEGEIEIEDTSVADTGENYDSGGESSSFFSDQTASAPSASVATPAAKKQWIPYKKIKSQAYSAAGFVVNAAYIARSGEDIQSISNTIFGSDQVSQLYAINPHLKAKSVKVGDKIYYQSPNRPQDSSQLLFYFEDRGIQPSYHQIQAGENIRTIASQLLGHAESWKEIWATNPDLQSKGRLDQPVTIKYWPADAVGGGAAEPTLPPPPQPEQPAGQQEEEPPPSPSMEETEEMPEEAEESPPLPPSKEEITPSEPSSEGGLSFSQVDMALAGLLALVALICAFIIIKKRMNKKKDFDYTAANFEIDE